MKILLLALFSFSLFAQEFKTEISEIDKESQVIQQTKNLNLRYKNAPTFCANKNYEAANETLCVTEIRKKAQQELVERFNLLVTFDIEEANKKLTDDVSELKCISALRIKLESLNIAYEVTHTCDQLKALIPKE